MMNVRGARRWREWLQDRRGAVTVLAACLMVVAFAFLAFAIDLGYLTYTKTRLQNAADSAALAAAQELNPNLDAATVRANARAAAQTTVNANLGTEARYFNSTSDIEFGRQTYTPGSSAVTTKWGDNQTPYNVVRVHAQRDQRTSTVAGVTSKSDERIPTFFAPVVGVSKASLDVTAVATFQPRDIMVVLDFSASMNDDSTFEGISRLGRTAVESNLQKIYEELGSPRYGTKLAFTPAYAVFSGQAATTKNPHNDITYKGTSISIASTKTISSVKLTFSGGSTQTISASATTGTFQGTGSNAGKVITNATVTSNKVTESFTFDQDGFLTALGLDSVAYPYPVGSWTEFIAYNTSSYYQPEDAGYRWKFGYMTFVNYLLDIRPSKAETPDLYKTTSYPAEALKAGVDVFTDFLSTNAAEDRVGLSIYSTATGAILEYGLTNDISKLKTTTRARQPGHYNPYTNIYAGMKLAREELVANARTKAFRLMVVMTDGLANMPTSTTVAKALVRQEAQLAKDNNIKILTISLGSKADPTLMQEVADIAGGIHYNVPGGATVDEYVSGMEKAFLEIGASRPLKLISDPGK